ncbi:hypothetical protein AB1Y20_012190 [Prymnesium parvum]|uniref:Uncharacterized protein n=1 Tax=Prymnesium parvum TaxID=97485 RepID=A0AB34IQ76_PRYPA
MSPPRNTHPRPRRHGGGRSTSYTARREARGTQRQHAAEWSDAASRAVFAALHEGCARVGVAICCYTEGVLREAADEPDLFASRECRGLCAADRALVSDILLCHSRRLAEAKTRDTRVRRVRAFLKPLRERARARGPVEWLDVAPRTPPPLGTFHQWLAARPEEERRRELREGEPTHAALSAWPRWRQEVWGVVCYERAAARLLAAHGGAAPTEETVRSLVRTDYLPQAVGSEEDHYVLLGPHGELRYMTVEEVARGFGVPRGSPLMATLVAPDLLTAAEAVSCLGESVHVGVARLLVRALVARGLLAPGATYGSAYAGLDGFGAAMEEELGGAWRYAFASERAPHVRRALLHTWARRGLAAPRCHDDAAGHAATHEAAVDLWSLTPSLCERRGASLSEVWASLGYARAAAPRVILVENAAEPEVSEPLTGLLQRLAGYKVASATLDPRTSVGAPMARERRFWVLTRASDSPPHAIAGSTSTHSIVVKEEPH